MATRTEIINALDKEFGKYKDSFGNYKFKGEKKVFRIKVQSLGLRFERLLKFSTGVTQWQNICDQPVYYKNQEVEKTLNVARKMKKLAEV